MKWTDLAAWIGPAADNFGDGDWTERESADRMTEHRGLVIHIAEGTYAGTVAWERNPSSDISSHWVLAKDGRCAQLVDTDDQPWTQGAGNAAWLSVECEGYAGEQLTAQQIDVLAQLLASAHREYGVPLQLADSPTDRGLGWHGMGGAAWGGHHNCPGVPIVAQRPAIIARATQIISGAPAPAEGGHTEMHIAKCGGSYVALSGGVVIARGWGDIQPMITAGVPVHEVPGGVLARLVALPDAGAPQPVTVTLTQEQLADIGAAAAAQAATVIGDRIEAVEAALAAAGSELAVLGVAQP